jgi:hypothetical protein
MDEKIIQISPAPVGMIATWVSEGEQKNTKIVCLALVEDKDGGRSVRPMAIYNANEIQLVPDTVGLRCQKV